MTRFLPIVLALFVAACTQGDAKQQKDGKAAGGASAALPVSVIQVASREVPVAFEAVGRTEGSREVQVRARVSGILEKQLYTEGDSVQAGATLFQIERAPFEIDLQQQRAALAQEKARYALAKQDADRLKGLADKRAISQREADQAASALQQSAAAVQLAQARVRQSELNLSYTTVEAPIEGITGRAMQSIGSLVAPNGDSALLTTLSRTDPIWVRFALSEAEFARLRARETAAPQVKLELADGSAYAEAGKMNFASSTVDANLGTVQMRAEFPNANLKVLPGQYVRVQVIAGTQQAIVVPQSAVQQNESGRFVWIMGDDGRAQTRNIRAGSWVDKDWIVLEGLRPGDKVITDNLVRLRPGSAVAAKPAA
ncbi:MAG: efflux RND transporter periplasmic adaptor subunit [Betaproteobacteria bacterium]|nr:efflux RND transporter periplasmic adaptor subunit [Betaproteobacteria bacterium]MBV9360754.1 efflux RND transporter periplasmic adaptor subunit [Betaproteobacteria bacterium]